MTDRPRHIPDGIPAANRTLRPRGRATMVRLLDAGLELLAEQGWHDTAVDDIAERARTSHGTFYLYFGSREDLLLTLAHECAADMTSLVDDLDGVGPGPPGQAAVRAWIERFVDTYDRYRGIVRAWMENQVDDPELAALRDDVMGRFGARFVGLIEAAGRAGGDGDEPIRAAALLGLLERFSYVVATRDPGFERDAVIDTLATIVHRGFLEPVPSR